MFKLYISTLNFLFNQSYNYYCLLLCFLLQSYWPFRIPITVILYYNMRFLSFEWWYYWCNYNQSFNGNPHCYFKQYRYSEFLFIAALWCCITLTVVDCFFVHFCMFPPCIWVWPIVWITDYIGSTPLDDDVIF